MAAYEYSCRLLKPDRRGSIQPGIRMWDPLHWNYTELIPAGAKLACEYGRLLSLSPALGSSAKSLSGVERL